MCNENWSKSLCLQTTWICREDKCLKNGTSRLGFIINESKTKYIKTSDATVSHQGANIVNISSGQLFAIFDAFVYLGALLQVDNDSIVEIKRRIMEVLLSCASIHNYMRFLFRIVLNFHRMKI